MIKVTLLTRHKKTGGKVEMVFVVADVFDDRQSGDRDPLSVVKKEFDLSGVEILDYHEEKFPSLSICISAMPK